MAEASDNFERLKEVVEKAFDELKKSFSCKSEDRDYNFVCSFTTYVANEEGDFELEILGQRYLLKPEFYSTQRCLIIRTYKRGYELSNPLNPTLEHVALMDVHMAQYERICFIHPEKKKYINHFPKDFMTELYYLIHNREKEYLDNIRENITAY
jgi:hypothetical protein